MTSISCLPQMNAFRGTQTSYNIPSHLVFSPDEPGSNPEAWVHLWMVKDLHKEWVFMRVGSHKLCEIEVSLCICIEIVHPPQT